MGACTVQFQVINQAAEQIALKGHKLTKNFTQKSKHQHSQSETFQANLHLPQIQLFPQGN